MCFDRVGFALIERVVSAEAGAQLLACLQRQALPPLRGGIRRIEQKIPEVAALARSASVLQIVTPYLSGRPRLVRAIYFDKSPTNNWFVTWHQDKTVAVSERFDRAGWGPWSLKAGVWHVQPPLEVLENMVTIRIHLDRATSENGCLKIVPGSHRLGIIASDQMHASIDRQHVVYCETEEGGAVVMRPHVLHASEKSTTDVPRRVLHFEYSSFQLPAGIEWAA